LKIKMYRKKSHCNFNVNKTTKYILILLWRTEWERAQSGSKVLCVQGNNDKCNVAEAERVERWPL
jgi:hypothetical protein